jgi:hypothetical protein
MFLSNKLFLALFFVHIGCSRSVDRTDELIQDLLVDSNNYKSATTYEINLPSKKREIRGSEIISWREDQVKVIEKGAQKRWYINENLIGVAQDLAFKDGKPILLPTETERDVPRQFFKNLQIVGTKITDVGFNFYVGDITYPPTVHISVIDGNYLLFQSPFFETFLSETPEPISIPEPFEAIQLRSGGIPVTILKSKNTHLPSPALVSVYGSYGEIHREFYSPLLLAALKKGLVRVLIHVRGGSELGFKHYEEKLNNPRVPAEDLNTVLTNLYRDGILKPDLTSLLAKSAGAVPVFLANPKVSLIFLRSPLLDLVRSTSDPNIPQFEREAFEWAYKAKELTPFSQPKLSAPIYIFHQRQDTITPLEDTVRFIKDHPAQLFVSDGDHLRASDEVVERRITAEILARALNL